MQMLQIVYHTSDAACHTNGTICHMADKKKTFWRCLAWFVKHKLYDNPPGSWQVKRDHGSLMLYWRYILLEGLKNLKETIIESTVVFSWSQQYNQEISCSLNINVPLPVFPKIPGRSLTAWQARNVSSCSPWAKAGSRCHKGGENVSDVWWKVIWRIFQIYLIAILKE